MIKVRHRRGFKLPTVARVPLEVNDTRRKTFLERHRNTLFGFIGLFLTLLLASFGFKLIGGSSWTWLDAFYMTVITLATVGYQEVEPLTQGGRMFAILVIVVGVSIFAYTLASIGEYIVAGQLRGDLQLNRTRRELDAMSGHHILVGYGHTGSIVAAELQRLSDKDVVVIEIDRDIAEEAGRAGFISIVGDAGQDDVLIRAGIERAASLVCAATPDSVAVLTVLSAHSLAPNLNIIARATLPDAEAKLARAGASRVVSAHHIAGRSIAESVVHTEESGLIPLRIAGQQLDLHWSEIEVPDNSSYINTSIGDSRLMEACDAHLVAVRTAIGGVATASTHKTIIKAGDRLIFIGLSEQISRVRDLIDRSVTHT